LIIEFVECFKKSTRIINGINERCTNGSRSLELIKQTTSLLRANDFSSRVFDGFFCS
jgi:hypothetical protein